MVQVESLKTERKFKKTEIGEIPVDWEVCRLGDYAYIKARIGWRGLSASEYTQEGPLLIAGNHIEGIKILWDKCDHISLFRYDESPEIKLQNGDVIISKDGTIGRLGFIDNIPQEATIGGTMMLIRPDDKWFYSKYVYYYFQGEYFQNIIKEKISGSSVPHIFQRDIVNLKVPIVPIPEQKKIAEILSTVDEAIEKSNEIIKKTKELKKGLMQELLTRGIGHKKFKKTEIGEIPVDWGIATLDELSDEIYRYPTYYNIKYLEEGIPEVRGELIKPNGTLDSDLSKYRFISSETAARFPRTRLKEGDFILSVRGTMGKVAIVPKLLNGANITANLIRISPNRHKILPLFLHQILIGEQFQEALNIASSSTTIKTIKAPELKKLRFVVPTLNEQKEIAEILSSVDEEIEKEEANKEQLENLKKGLMQVLLTGKVRVKN